MKRFPFERVRGPLLALALIAPSIRAQAPADSAVFGWKRSGTGMLNLSQAYHDNWVKGGTDNLTWELNFQGEADLERDGFLWENKAKLVYGLTRIEDQAARKSSDEWNLETIYTWKLGSWVNPFVSALGRSQFTAGYRYADTLPRVQTSDFFDPAYVFQTAGVGVEPVKDLKQKLGFTLKETFSADYGYADDGETAEFEDFSLEYGLSSVTEYQASLMENILATTRLDLFVNFEGWEDIDARWENKVTAKVNKLVSVNFDLEILYDKDQDLSRQLRQGLSVGIAFLSL